MRTYIQYGKRLEELVEISEPEGDQATADAVVAKAVTPDEESEDSWSLYSDTQVVNLEH